MTKKMYSHCDRVNKELAFDIINGYLPFEKRVTLSNALVRNLLLTSSRVLSKCEYTVYKEGWYFQFHGTRSGFSIYAKDNDGEFEVIRKPKDSELHKLYDGNFNCYESDFDTFCYKRKTDPSYD